MYLVTVAVAVDGLGEAEAFIEDADARGDLQAAQIERIVEDENS